MACFKNQTRMQTRQFLKKTDPVFLASELFPRAFLQRLLFYCVSSNFIWGFWIPKPGMSMFEKLNVQWRSCTGLRVPVCNHFWGVARSWHDKKVNEWINLWFCYMQFSLEPGPSSLAFYRMLEKFAILN